MRSSGHNVVIADRSRSKGRRICGYRCVGDIDRLGWIACVSNTTVEPMLTVNY